MVKDNTLYNILQVEPDADETQIKKAYNKLSKIWHPDKNPENQEEAHTKFQEITQARDILLDADKRAQYDMLGMDMFKNGNVDVGNGGSPFGDPGFDAFAHMFQHGFSFNMGNQNQQQVEELKVILNCTLDQIYNESVVKFNYKSKITCTVCDGNGTKPGASSKCSDCDGRGMRVQVIRMGNMVQQMVQPCGNCNGSGTIINNENKCNNCNGKTYIHKDRSVDVPLKSGLITGNKVVFSGKGHNIKNTKSDLLVVINIAQHPIFKRYNVSGRESCDLYIDLELSLYQALFGFDKVIKHLDERKLRVHCSGKTEFNSIRKIPGEGMKCISDNTKGDLYIRFLINLPNVNLTNDNKQLLKSIFQESDSLLNENDTINTTLNNCKKDECDKINVILYNIKNGNDQQHTQNRKQHHEGQQQCVHQ